MLHPDSGSLRLRLKLVGGRVNFRERIKGVGIALALLIGCFPVAVVITLITSPVWSWYEAQFGIEAYGHSGPAEWCYLVSYGLLIAGCAIIWSRVNRSKPGKEFD